MVRKKECFDKVYFVDNPEVLSRKQMDSLLMVSTKNWNHYFLDLGKKPSKKIIFNEIENVELCGFNSPKAMFGFLKNLDKKSLLDFSLEHEKPCILKLA